MVPRFPLIPNLNFFHPRGTEHPLCVWDSLMYSILVRSIPDRFPYVDPEAWLAYVSTIGIQAQRDFPSCQPKKIVSVGPRYASSNCLVKMSNCVVLHYFYVAAKETILTGSSTNWVKYACYPLGDIKTCLRMSELPIYRQIPHKTSPINQLIWTGQAITTVTNSRQIDSPKTITLSHSSHSQAICLETGLWYRARQLAFSIHLMSE